MANKKPWDVKASEGVGKAIPNELSKTSSWLRFIPWIGQALSTIGGIDAGATTYADMYNAGKDAGLKSGQARSQALMPAVQEFGNTAMGTGTNPGKYGSSGNKLDKNWADYAGTVGNVWSKPSVGSVLNTYDMFSGKGASSYGINPYGQQQYTEPKWEQGTRAAGNYDLGSLFNIFGKKSTPQTATPLPMTASTTVNSFNTIPASSRYNNNPYLTQNVSQNPYIPLQNNPYYYNIPQMRVTPLPFQGGL